MSAYWLIEHKFCVPRRYAKIGAMQRVQWVNDPLSATRFDEKRDAEWYSACARDDGEPAEIHSHINLSGPMTAALTKAGSQS